MHHLKKVKPMNQSQLKICLIALSLVSFSPYAEVAVIVSAANQQALSEADIKNLFTGKQKSFPDGNPATAWPDLVLFGH